MCKTLGATLSAILRQTKWEHRQKGYNLTSFIMVQTKHCKFCVLWACSDVKIWVSLDKLWGSICILSIDYWLCCHTFKSVSSPTEIKSLTKHFKSPAHNDYALGDLGQPNHTWIFCLHSMKSSDLSINGIEPRHRMLSFRGCLVKVPPQSSSYVRPCF